MPCDSIRYNRSDFAKASMSVLRAAILRAGLTITSEDLERGNIGFRDESYRRGWFRNGEFTAAEGIDIDAIKRQYSNEAVERASKQYGFTAKKTADNKYRLTRRAY